MKKLFQKIMNLFSRKPGGFTDADVAVAFAQFYKMKDGRPAVDHEWECRAEEEGDGALPCFYQAVEGQKVSVTFKCPDKECLSDHVYHGVIEHRQDDWMMLRNITVWDEVDRNDKRLWGFRPNLPMRLRVKDNGKLDMFAAESIGSGIILTA